MLSKDKIPTQETLKSLLGNYTRNFDIDLDETGLIPITFIYDKIVINSSSEQEWIGNYYYPVLPKLNRVGEFETDSNTMYPYDYIPFNQDGIITKEHFQNSSLQINITSNTIQSESDVLDDLSGLNNYGFTFSDYKPRFDNKTTEPKRIRKTDSIKKSTKDGAF